MKKSNLFIMAGLSLAVILGLWLNQQKSKNSSGKPELTVYTYSSFQSYYGPGPELVKEFEKTCNCKVNLVNAGDAGLILQRMKLQKDEVVDLVIGLDQFTKVEAEAQTNWKKSDLSGVSWNPLFNFVPETQSEAFVPYDWAPMTFIYREKGSAHPPKDLKEFVEERFKKKVSLQDPRMSTPGMQFLFWLVSHFGEDEGLKYYEKLIANKNKVSPSWSSAYGLFTQNKASYVFSYFTSAVYHWVNEKDKNYQPLFLENVKYPVQVEYSAIPESCGHCDLALQMQRFLLSPTAQKIIMNKNVMLPVVAGVTKGTEYDQLKPQSLMTKEDYNQVIHRKKQLVEKWSGLIR